MTKNIQTIENMWKFIENILVPYGLMPNKVDLTNEQIMKLYSELVITDVLFRELEQIEILKRS